MKAAYLERCMRAVVAVAAAAAGAAVADAVAAAGADANRAEFRGAVVRVVNDAYRRHAIDAELVSVSARGGLPLERLELARQLRPGGIGAAVEAPAGAARVEVRLVGSGGMETLRKRLRLEAGSTYCAIVVDGLDGRLVVTDVTRQAARDPGDDACREAAAALGAALPIGLPRPVAAARADLADELDAPVASVRLIAYEETVWPDTALGCPAPGMVYAQVMVPGYWVLLEVGGANVEYHTDDADPPEVLRCEGAMIPAWPAGR